MTPESFRGLLTELGQAFAQTPAVWQAVEHG
jgi:hypothetical protein